MGQSTRCVARVTAGSRTRVDFGLFNNLIECCGRPLTRGRGLKRVRSERTKCEASPPHTGARIETPCDAARTGRLIRWTSPPHTGARIETSRIPLPRRGAHTGARILGSDVQARGRPLTRGRGLKPRGESAPESSARRPLTRGRGLKHHRLERICVGESGSPPHTGARIETVWSELAWVHRLVAPSHGGAD